MPSKEMMPPAPKKRASEAIPTEADYTAGEAAYQRRLGSGEAPKATKKMEADEPQPQDEAQKAAVVERAEIEAGSLRKKKGFTDRFADKIREDEHERYLSVGETLHEAAKAIDSRGIEVKTKRASDPAGIEAAMSELSANLKISADALPKVQKLLALKEQLRRNQRQAQKGGMTGEYEAVATDLKKQIEKLLGA